MTAAGSTQALVIGSTGITGQSVSRQLAAAGWTTFGLSRSGAVTVDGVTSIRADLQEPAALTVALAEVSPELLVVTAWARQATEAKNIRVNAGAVRNVLAALEGGGTLRHVALLTGLKHYLGPFEAYGKAVMAETPFHEDEPRLDYPNFYYAQEDELFASAGRNGFTWSVHRAHTVFGYATGNAMNMALTLSVYAAICRELGQPFVYPGSQQQWDGLTDITDADLLGEQMIWASTSPAGENEPFNIANGDVFRWRWMWPRLAAYFGLDWEGYDGAPRPLEPRMTNAPELWQSIARKHGLVESDVTKLASWWHTDGDLGRTIECLTDMTKSRKAGFLGFRDTTDSFIDKAERYRAARIIP